MELYNRIIDLCRKNGLTAAKMCKYAGIKSPNLLTELKMGRVKSLSNSSLKMIADYFGVTTQYLLYGDDDVTSVKIPVYGVIAAGLPILAEQQIIDYEEIPKKWAKLGEYYGLQVRGDSMEPLMTTGDIVIMRKSEEFESGKICAVMVNGEEATLKRVQVGMRGITLLPANPKYPLINFSEEDVETLPVRCLGIAVEVRRKL